MQAGTTHQDYLDRFSTVIIPTLEAFKPELLLVSAGFDAHRADPLAALELTEETYRWLGEQLADIAKAHSQSRILSTLEGGYNVQVLAECVQSYLQGIESFL